jgi:hypothetical protein
MTRATVRVLAALVTVAAVLLVIFAARAHLDRLRVEADSREAAALQRAELERMGAVLAREASRKAEARLREMEEIVPSLRAELAAARRTGAVPAIVTNVRGDGTAVAVPCGDQVPRAPAVEPAAAEGTPPPIPSVAVTPHARAESAVFVTADGTIATKGRLFAWLTWKDGASPVQELSPSSIEAIVAPEIGAAWRAYQDRSPRVSLVPRPLRHWRLGYACGIGVGLGFDARAWTGAACIVGVSF